MAKTVAFDVDARQSLKRGIDIVAESVRITLGPKGRNVVLEKKFGAPTVTNDGVTIVREIERMAGEAALILCRRLVLRHPHQQFHLLRARAG